MADNKKYYYLKLKENFFEEDASILLESMPDGYLYSNILLKLYLRSLKNGGKLMFNDLIPYNSQMLASVTRHQVGTVEKALRIFEQMGIIEIMDSGAIYMMDIQNYIGKSSTEADRIREYRSRIEDEKKSLPSCTNVQHLSDKSTPEKEIELEKELDIEKEENNRSSDDDPKPVKKKSESKTKIEQEFDTLWAEYPRKEGKKKAYLSYERARKHGTTFEQVKKGIEGYKAKIEKQKIENQYIKQGSTWFNGECWNDDYSDSAPKVNIRKWCRDHLINNPDALPF